MTRIMGKLGRVRFYQGPSITWVREKPISVATGTWITKLISKILEAAGAGCPSVSLFPRLGPHQQCDHAQARCMRLRCPAKPGTPEEINNVRHKHIGRAVIPGAQTSPQMGWQCSSPGQDDCADEWWGLGPRIFRDIEFGSHNPTLVKLVYFQHKYLRSFG